MNEGWESLDGLDDVALRDRIEDLQDRLARQIATTHDEGPYLGLADTEMLMRELITRFKMNMYGAHTKMLDFDRALVLAEMLGSMGATEREYRPVDHG